MISSGIIITHNPMGNPDQPSSIGMRDFVATAQLWSAEEDGSGGEYRLLELHRVMDGKGTPKSLASTTTNLRPTVTWGSPISGSPSHDVGSGLRTFCFLDLVPKLFKWWPMSLYNMISLENPLNASQSGIHSTTKDQWLVSSKLFLMVTCDPTQPPIFSGKGISFEVLWQGPKRCVGPAPLDFPKQPQNLKSLNHLL